ncbi:hypothetical protein R3P38DRAFT_2583362 [Favolaschia claudopus]|uniref:Integrase core domain-containing protein n=1 Tax=Favolaschia claudopus TaxID=2862362 RepID=A0AAV9Z9A5_9AGAR
MSSFNRNPTGKNQYIHDEEHENKVAAALKRYHRQGVTNYGKLSKLLAAEHGLTMKPRTVQRRLSALGLFAAKKTREKLTFEQAEQLVVSELDNDPAQRAGVQTIKARVAMNADEILPKSLVAYIMHLHAPEGFAAREPTAKKIFRVPKYPVGSDQRWSGDGHDKLYKIGFPLYGYCDDATAMGLQYRICPSNRYGKAVLYIWLDLVEDRGGMPVQTSTDCGAETTELCATTMALRTAFHPGFDETDVEDELPAHVYLKSVHNISIERSWLRLRLDVGDNCVFKFNEGIEKRWYVDKDADQYELCQFLWSRIIQAEIDKSINLRNVIKTRKQKEKPGPSGMSRHEAYVMPEEWGGKHCLLKIPRDFVHQMKEDLGGEALLEFTEPEFTARAMRVLDSLQPVQLSLQNGWKLFQTMLPLVFPERNDFWDILKRA